MIVVRIDGSPEQNGILAGEDGPIMVNESLTKADRHVHFPVEQRGFLGLVYWTSAAVWGVFEFTRERPEKPATALAEGRRERGGGLPSALSFCLSSIVIPGRPEGPSPE